MEKTFKELIEAEFARTGRRMMGTENIIEMMQKVREATIAECEKAICYKGYKDIALNFREQKWNLNNLPSDRILITENEE